MLEVSNPTLSFRPATLELEERPVRGSVSPPNSSLHGWLSVGEPVAIPITENSVSAEKELIDFVRAEWGQYRFHLVHLACSFKAAEGESFQNAWLQVHLARQGSNDPPKPIAWSMVPKRVVEGIETSTSLKLGTDLKFLEAATVGIELETTRKSTTQKISIEAMRELESEPAWELTHTSASPISGTYRFAVVVRRPSAGTAIGQLRLLASVNRKHLGFFTYRAMFEKSPHISFALE